MRDGQVIPRLLLPLSLTFDHRVADGADGARFASDIVRRLEHADDRLLTKLQNAQTPAAGSAHLPDASARLITVS